MSSCHQHTSPKYYLFYFLLSVWLLATLSWPRTVHTQLPSGSSSLTEIQTSFEFCDEVTYLTFMVLIKSKI